MHLLVGVAMLWYNLSIMSVLPSLHQQAFCDDFVRYAMTTDEESRDEMNPMPMSKVHEASSQPETWRSAH